ADRDWVLDDAEWSPKAWMSVRDADLVEHALLAVAGRGEVAVLEWGSGGSTAYFTRLLEKRGTPYRWLSIEYDRGFFEATIAAEAARAGAIVHMMAPPREGNRDPAYDALRASAPASGTEYAVFDYG